MITRPELRELEAMKASVADSRREFARWLAQADEAAACIDEVVATGAPEAGRIAGYAVLWGLPYSDGEIIRRGAFARSLDDWCARGKMPPMWQAHGKYAGTDPLRTLPFGEWLSIKEDEKGLYVEGRIFALDTALCRAARQFLAAREFGLSIAGTTKYRDRMDHAWTEISLREITLTLSPSQPLAVIEWTPSEAEQKAA